MPRLTVDEQFSFSRAQAAEASGYPKETIDAAVRSGDLRETFPEINGRRIRRGVIMRDDLLAWLRGSAS